MQLLRTRLGLSALAASFVFLASCSTTQGSAGEQPDHPWLVPSSRLKAQIEDQATRLPWTHGIERVEVIRWFASVGEPAYPTLLAMVQDPRDDVAGAALAAIGATRDSRLVDHLHQIPWPPPDEVDLVLERSRTLLHLGDWSVTPNLIEGLRDDRLITRALCAQALYEVTRERFGFDPRGEEEERQAAVERWEAWWRERNRDPLLPGLNGLGGLN